MSRTEAKHSSSKTSSEADADLARESASLLSSSFGRAAGAVQLQFADDAGRSQTVTIPASALEALLTALAQIAKGYAVRVIPKDADLTTQEAANLLDVSRPYMVRLLDEGRIPHHKVGTHRRVSLRDLIACRAEHRRLRAAALKDLTRLSEELGLY